MVSMDLVSFKRLRNDFFKKYLNLPNRDDHERAKVTIVYAYKI